MKITHQPFGEINEHTITLYTLHNNNGVEVSCIDYGCIITKILAPDANGRVENIVLGYDELESYLTDPNYFGAVVGRVGGRIANGKFDLGGKCYDLPKNDGQNHLHGGPNGFNNAIWEAKPFDSEDKIGIQFFYKSSDGEGGYPGNLAVTVTYCLTNENDFTISYAGVSDQDTLLNLTNHTYFNLSGNLKETILNHELVLQSNHYLELNKELLPTGKKVDVTDTSFDFRNGRKIMDGVLSNDHQNELVGHGYDHPFLLADPNNDPMILSDQSSGRKVALETTEPCVVLYTGNSISEDFEVRGVPARKYLGMCLETQLPPDAINHPDFPSIVLEKGKEYHSSTTYTFGVMK
ncbi:aldose epimerase family protein [Bacillus sp. N1-1]|uniref:aldose epimerase family protein n=1 Tax=Bacillus sp. N1-1 TaxID=2682541 RepID=UPI0013176B41|nr:aldose epimerase family protein [Bacillus sp. N1-1]QHA93556.1 galactose-1-epimerase [Bacillus sp. N1-1]